MRGEASFAVTTRFGVFRCYYSPAGITRLVFPASQSNSRKTPHHSRWSCPFDTKRFARDINTYLRGTDVSFSYPLDIAGTPFQRNIWSALTRIPHGDTWTYQKLAEQAGCKGSSRAAGNACGKNPVPILIPCHRVVRSDGALGGFSAGLRWKKILLRIEGITFSRRRTP